MRDPHFKKLLLAGLILMVLSLLLSLFIGSRDFPTGDLFAVLLGKGSSSAEMILLNVRLPRAMAGLLCGASLACGGLLLQTSLDNVLASPGIIGVNQGAGLLTLLAAILFPGAIFLRTLFAFGGAVITVLIVWAIARNAGLSRTSLILSGVAVASLMTAASNAIITLRPESVTDKAAFTVGGLSMVTWRQIIFALPVILICITIALLLGSSLDLLAVGDEAAQGLGLNTKACRFTAVILAAVLSGAAVSIAGLLSFLGLIVPNLIRRRGRHNTRGDLLLSAVYGGSFLTLMDLLAKDLFYPYELPVGILLSLIGAPFFLWILIRRRRRLGE